MNEIHGMGSHTMHWMKWSATRVPNYDNFVTNIWLFLSPKYFILL